MAPSRSPRSSAQPCSLDWRGARRTRMQILRGSPDTQVGPCPRGVPGAGRCRGGWQELSCGARAVAGQQRRGDGGEAVLGRLDALEADVRFLCTELGAEKLLWSSRFLELLREQQSLRQRLQELPWQWNSADSPELLGEAEDQSASGSEGESPEGRQWMETPRQPRGSIQPDRQKI
ncbi:uncharacterized protein FYW23_012552 isoform 3-T3 [Sylvia borin]